MENIDGIDDVDGSSASGGVVSRSTPQTFTDLFDLYCLHYWRWIFHGGLELQMLKEWNIFFKEPTHGLSNAISQENSHFSQEEDRTDTDIHDLVADQEEELNPHSFDSSSGNPHSLDSSGEAEIIHIAFNKRILPGDGRDRPRTRVVDAEQEQGGLPSFSNTAHSFAPSGSHIANFINFLSVLMSLCYNSQFRSFFTSSESRGLYTVAESTSVDTEMNSAAGSHAYCFGNAFVRMSDIYGSPAVPVLLDSAQRVTQSFENGAAFNDDDSDSSNVGHDDNLDGLEINLPM